MWQRVGEVIEKITAILCLLTVVMVLMGRQGGGSKTPEPLDIGPHPSLVVQIRTDASCELYGTFVTYGYQMDAPSGIEERVLKVFQQQTGQIDGDGLQVSLGHLSRCYDGSRLSGSIFHGQMIIERFKLLVYVPEYDLWIRTEQVTEPYGFGNKYVFDLRGIDFEANRGHTVIADDRLHDYQGKDFAARTVDLVIRAVLTFLIEWGVAVVFYKWKGKYNTVLILVTNLITQTLFNIFCFHMNLGPLLLFSYPIGEIAVFVVETIIYCKFMQTDHDDWTRVVGYAFAANLITAIIGFWPGLFMDIMISGMFY